MGAAIQIFLRRSAIPSIDDWNAAIKAAGFDLVIDPFDLETGDGYCPAFVKGEESGFEWYLADVATAEELPDYPFKAFIGDCDLKAVLCFTSHANERNHIGNCRRCTRKIEQWLLLGPGER